MHHGSSFSFILQHHKTLKYRYFYASNNAQLLKSPCLTCNQLVLQSKSRKNTHLTFRTIQRTMVYNGTTKTSFQNLYVSIKDQDIQDC